MHGAKTAAPRKNDHPKIRYIQSVIMSRKRRHSDDSSSDEEENDESSCDPNTKHEGDEEDPEVSIVVR